MVFLFILLILFLIVLTIKIKIEIHNVKFTIHEPVKNAICEEHNSFENQNKKIKIFNINNNYKIKISIKIIGFLPIFTTKLTSEKIDIISKKIKKLNIKSHLKSFNKDTSLLDARKIIENLNFRIKEFNLKAKIGLDSIMLLTYIIPVLSTIISIILSKKKVKIKNQFYQIQPIYNKRKFIKC